MISDLIYAYLGQVFDYIEKKHAVWISDIIWYVSTRPFNMKWQEFQELIVYPLKKAINNEMSSQLGIKIDATSDKKKTDLFLDTNHEKYNFSIKNYQTTRFQVSTMVDKLTKYEWWFSSYTHDSKIILDDTRKNEIISDIKSDLSDDITIFALTKLKKRSEKIDIYFLSLNENFLDNIEYMEAEYADRIKTPHRRIRFYFPGIKWHLFTLDLWKNALNRGLRWENRNEHIEDNDLRKKFFYDLLAVTEKDLTPFTKISQDAKNEALIKIIEEAIKAE